MKRITYILITMLVLAGCDNNINNEKATKTKTGDSTIENDVNVSNKDMVQKGKIGYADIVSFLANGFKCSWDSMKPEDQGLSPVYSYCSKYAGYAIKDINGDGIEELLIGDMFENGTYSIYDIFTINSADGSLIHLAKGGERDTYSITGDGIIVETGSNSAFDSFNKGYLLNDGKLEEVQAWHETLMIIKFELFLGMVVQRDIVGAFGEQRDITDEEMEMFRNATDYDGFIVYTALSVSTQVVAGINYRFWCSFEDLSPNLQGEEKKPNNSGYCWITIYKPLPGQGEPRVTAFDIDDSSSLKYGGK